MSTLSSSHQEPSEHHDDIIYPTTVPFLLLHLACFAAMWSGITAKSVIIAISLYFLRMFAITAGYHRYFSHRSFRTSRVFQFVLAFLAQTSAQKGVLWWSSKHRHHHKYSDTPEDSHSPLHHGFWFSHFGWVFSVKRGKADYSNVKDLTAFPELVWLDRFLHLPALILAICTFALDGWPGLIVGFCWSTVALYHGTFAINSLAHMWGSKRYYTGDDSRNNWFLAMITMGEGWHNNHHYYMASARQGFFWWEIDPTYYILKGLSKIGVVWELHMPPKKVLEGERRLSRAMIEKAAQEIFSGLQVEKLRSKLEHNAHALEQEIRQRAVAILGNTPSIDEVIETVRRKLQAQFPQTVTGS